MIKKYPHKHNDPRDTNKAICLILIIMAISFTIAYFIGKSKGM